MRRYGNLEERLSVLGGYAAESEAASLSASLGLPQKVLRQPLRTLSGGQRRRVELARILFGGSDTLLLDEPTNHLDADSVAWLRDHLRSFRGGLVVISHDTALLDSVVNKVFHLDADRSALDIYNLGWKAYLEQRETDARRRRRERVNAERQATALQSQADKMRAKATKAKAAQSMAKRAEKLLAGVSADRARGPGGPAALPGARALRQDPADRARPDQVLRVAGGLRRRRHGGRPGIAGGRARAERRRARPRCCGCWAESRTPMPARCCPGMGCGWVITPKSTRHWITSGPFWRTCDPPRPNLTESDQRGILGSFLFSGDDVAKPVGVLSGGEKTRLALALLVVSGANVLLLDEPTNNLDPGSRAEILGALRRYQGAIVLVTHDEGAVEALPPERVVLLPDGVEDAWSEELGDLVALA